MITQSYKLNIVPYAEQTVRGMTSPKVPVSQYDKGLRTLVFDLYDGANGRLTLLDGQTAKIYGKKPDANVFEYDMTISEDRKSVSIVLQEQMAVIAGCVECEVRIFQGVSTIGSANFTLIVEPAPVGADEVYSESEIPEIDNLLYGGTAGQVFTKTATGAHWADLGTSSDFMLKSVYDPNDDGSVLKADHADDADTVDGYTVARNVLADEYTNAQIDGLIEQTGKVKTVNEVQPDQSGNVQITKADIGLSNVDNTSDANKPISTATQAALDLKVDKVDGKGLSANDFTDGLKSKLEGIEAGAQVNTVTGVKGDSEADYRTGNINITKANIGLGNVDNTSDANKPVSTATQTALDGKVDKVNGKGLSANDFTDTLKDKLDGIAAGAEVNVQADWNQSDNTADDYIKNKPAVNGAVWGNVTGTLSDQTDLQTALNGKVNTEAGKGLSTEDFTTAEKNKLSGIAAGAEVNVQANWNEADSTADDYIKNKPAIPAKTSDLQNDSGFITGVNWGGIGGTLSDQVDLNNELTALNTGLTSVKNDIATIETSPTTHAYSVGDYLVYNSQLYKVTAAIAIGESLTVGTNIESTSLGNEIGEMFIQAGDVIGRDVYGYGVYESDTQVRVIVPFTQTIKASNVLCDGVSYLEVYSNGTDINQTANITAVQSAEIVTNGVLVKIDGTFSNPQKRHVCYARVRATFRFL